MPNNDRTILIRILEAFGETATRAEMIADAIIEEGFARTVAEND